jgi:hypothetical protein
VYEGLEGGFMSIHQHALVLSTMFAWFEGMEHHQHFLFDHLNTNRRVHLYNEQV